MVRLYNTSKSRFIRKAMKSQQYKEGLKIQDPKQFNRFWEGWKATNIFNIRRKD